MLGHMLGLHSVLSCELLIYWLWFNCKVLEEYMQHSCLNALSWSHLKLGRWNYIRMPLRENNSVNFKKPGKLPSRKWMRYSS